MDKNLEVPQLSQALLSAQFPQAYLSAATAFHNLAASPVNHAGLQKPAEHTVQHTSQQAPDCHRHGPYYTILHPRSVRTEREEYSRRQGDGE